MSGYVCQVCRDCVESFSRRKSREFLMNGAGKTELFWEVCCSVTLKRWIV